MTSFDYEKSAQYSNNNGEEIVPEFGSCFQAFVPSARQEKEGGMTKMKRSLMG